MAGKASKAGGRTGLAVSALFSALFGSPSAQSAKGGKPKGQAQRGGKPTPKGPRLRASLAPFQRPLGAFSRAAEDRLYKGGWRSFPSQLPFMEYLPESELFLLEDGVSRAFVMTLLPVPTEGRDSAELEGRRDQIQQCLQQVFESRSNSPWVIQAYWYAESDLHRYMDEIRRVTKPELLNEPLTQEYMRVMEQHLRGIAGEQGIFKDTEVTQERWRGQLTRCKLVVYRRVSRKDAALAEDGDEEMMQYRERLEIYLRNAGISAFRDDGWRFFEWMRGWFNPRPSATHGDSGQLADTLYYPRGEQLPVGYDLAESLVLGSPRVDPSKGLWWFDDLPHTVVRVKSLSRCPKVGALTGEIPQAGDKASCATDQLPPGSVLCVTMVMISQDEAEGQIARIANKSVGDSSAVERTREAIDEARANLGKTQTLCRSSVAVYVRGENERDLRSKRDRVGAILSGAGLMPYPTGSDELACEGYLALLPMNYNPGKDVKKRFVRLNYLQHAVNVLPVWGRSEGTGNPGFLFFNRGGSPMGVDPYKQDRRSNAHQMIFGPTGAGKSALLNYMAVATLATQKPRLFIVEKGDSFGLLADFCKRFGLTVNRVKITPNSDVSLPPFADSHLLFEGPAAKQGGETEQEADDQRDPMGEMFAAAVLMITGGDVKEEEKLGNGARGVLKRAIQGAAKKAYDDNRRQMLTEDLVAELNWIVETEGEEKLGSMCDQVLQMANAIHGGYCLPGTLEAKIFNRPGQAWPEADVTIFDFGVYAGTNYGSQLAIAYTGLMLKFTALAERGQRSGRSMVMITDESHLVTANELLSRLVVMVVKTFRKLGAWKVFATQNVEDMKDSAKKLLAMVEWWFCLLPGVESEKIADINKLSSETVKLMRSCRKQKGGYTEGVVIAPAVAGAAGAANGNSTGVQMFRNVPPSLFLALAGTEQEEKEQRQRIMDDMGITNELDAVYEVARRLDIARGIVKEAA